MKVIVLLHALHMHICSFIHSTSRSLSIFIQLIEMLAFENCKRQRFSTFHFPFERKWKCGVCAWWSNTCYTLKCTIALNVNIANTHISHTRTYTSYMHSQPPSVWLTYIVLRAVSSDCTRGCWYIIIQTCSQCHLCVLYRAYKHTHIVRRRRHRRMYTQTQRPTQKKHKHINHPDAEKRCCAFHRARLFIFHKINIAKFSTNSHCFLGGHETPKKKVIRIRSS